MQQSSGNFAKHLQLNRAQPQKSQKLVHAALDARPPAIDKKKRPEGRLSSGGWSPLVPATAGNLVAHIGLATFQLFVICNSCSERGLVLLLH